MGVPHHLIKLIRKLYENSEAVVKLEKYSSQPFHVQKGVRQGCILSPRLFNAYGEYIMRRALDDYEGGISIGGKKLTNLRYADDTTLLAKDEDELRKMLKNVTTESKKVGLQINLTKTKLMVIPDRGNILPQGNVLEQIENANEFIYI